MTQEVPSWQRWLDKPQSALMCLASWILSSAIFVCMVALFGGPTHTNRGGIPLCHVGNRPRQTGLCVSTRRPGSDS